MLLTKDKVQTILDNAPKGADKTKILDGLIQRGYDLEGVDSEARRQQLSASQTEARPPEEKKEGLWSRIKNDIINRADKVGEILNRKDSSTPEKAVQVFGQGAGAAASTAEKVVGAVPGVEPTLEKLGEGINWLATSDFSPIKHLGDAIGSDKTLQEMVRLYDTDQNFKDTVDGVANIVRLGGDVQAVVEGATFAKNVTNKVIAGASKGTVAATEGLAGSLEKGAQTISDAAGAAKDKIQLAVAEKNVSPQLKESASRLFLDGTQRLEQPIQKYDQYLELSKKAAKDIKADPAIAVVGDEIGDAFGKVVAERRKVGATMGEELKKVGGVQTNILPSVDNFVGDLSSEGLVYDRVKRALIQTTKQTKMSSEDLKILETYGRELQALGSKPTLAELDAFMSRVSSEINVYKGSKNITGTTNAERIIKKNLADLRQQFDPVKADNPELAAYAEARAKYAEYSDFIEEGENYLGKVTQSGDFAKDASLAKSSVQSVLNNGKKDWLIELENLTGYPAVDNSVLALQAMKDAGDFRGTSLLQAMSEGSVPTSATGIARKVLEYLLGKGSEIVAGTPEEQTRAFLQSLEKSQNAPPTTNTTPTSSAR